MIFSRQSIAELSKAIEAALVEIEVIHGIRVKLQGGNFTAANATLKLEISSVDEETGEPQDKRSEDFKRCATRYGLNPEDLGRSFSSRQGRYTIVGLSTKASGYPIFAKNTARKTYKFPAGVVATALKSETTIGT